MLYRVSVAAIAAAMGLAACASVAPPPPAAPDFAEITPSAAPARSVLYTDCIGQAISVSAVARVARGDGNLLRFTCTGAPAQRFYEAIGVMGDKVSVWQAEGRTFRATDKVQEDLFGVDYCSNGAANDAVCQIVLNTGPFLTAAP